MRNIENPRLELEEHYYRPDHQKLFDLGYTPSDVEDELRIMLDDLARYRHRIEAKRDVLIPDVRWDGRRRRPASWTRSWIGRRCESGPRFEREGPATRSHVGSRH